MTIDPEALRDLRRETFTLQLERDQDGRVERIGVEACALDGEERYLQLNGIRAGAVAPRLWDILRSAGVTSRRWTGRRPIELEAVTGAHVWLLISSLKPLRRPDRIDEVADGVTSMSREEAAYWYARTTDPRGLRSLRLLLSDDRRRR